MRKKEVFQNLIVRIFPVPYESLYTIMIYYESVERFFNEQQGSFEKSFWTSFKVGKIEDAI